MIADTWDRGFATCDPYRGLNANMHAVEALLAAHEVGGDAGGSWPLEAAARIADRVVDVLGPAYGWRLPEHFTTGWDPVPAFNVDTPADPFRPYGVTIGHLLEWSRLLLHLDAVRPDPRFPTAASALTGAAVRDGWATDGADGFVYTVDFEGVPVVRERMHWVVAEAIANAAARAAASLDGSAETDLASWTGWALEHHRDLAGGSWWHELDAGLRPSGTVWPGKPDVYHPLQALWLSRHRSRPLTGSFAGLALSVG
jgi:mannose/cellobiose epimerase-like protein (N-acyl-D-glucosamine 2-epimerase family)